MGDSEEPGEFGLEMEQRPLAGWGVVEVVERALEEVVQFWLRVLGLDSRFQQLATIGGEEGGGVVLSESLAPVPDHHFAQGVKLTVSGVDKGDFSTEKKIDLAGKRAAGTARTFGHGLH